MEISLAVIDRVADEGWIGKDLEGSARFLIEVIPQYLHERSDEKHRKEMGSDSWYLDRGSNRAPPKHESRDILPH
jgi:hypothetical protein